MEKTLSYMAEVDDRERDKRVEKVMEKILGVSLRTKLEKLADSFEDVKSCIHPDEENPDMGFIAFAYTGPYIFKKEESEIRKIAERLYKKEDYTVCVGTSDKGFDIVILESIFKNLRNKKIN